MVTFSSKFASSSPLFQSLRILPIFELNNFQICIFLFKSIHKLLPLTFQNIFQFNNEIHNYSTRSAGDLHPTFFRTTTAQFSIKYRGPHFWNCLPRHIRDCISFSMFRRQLMQFLLENLGS